MESNKLALANELSPEILDKLKDIITEMNADAFQATEDTLKSLRQYYEEFVSNDREIAKGDFVVWKEGFKNKSLPKYGQPAIVIDILDQPLFDNNKDAGSPYFNEPLDVVLGFFDTDKDFMLYHFDRRRFKVYTPESLD